MSKHALIVIDLQNDYYPGGKWTLENIENASNNAARIISAVRRSQDTIIHVHHEFLMENPPFFAPGTPGADINKQVTPLETEQKVLKNRVNAFLDTNLKELLDREQIGAITLIGAMSHMCIDAAARSASDFGYDVTVIEDACASKDLEFNKTTVKAKDVHNAYMSALSFAYAKVIGTDEFLGALTH